MIEVDIKIQGLEEMKRLLKELPFEVKNKALNQSVKDTAGITLGYALALSPYRTGALRRNIKLVMKRKDVPWKQVAGLRVKTARQQTKRLGFLEGTLKGESRATPKGSDDPYYWFFLEFGTKNIKPARKFLRPALEDHVGEHITGFTRAFLPRLEAVAKRLHAKQKRSARASGKGAR